MSQTTSKRSTERRIGRKCAECGDHYQAVVVDESGRTIREGCGCRVEIVPSRLGDIDRQTDNGIFETDASVAEVSR